MFRGYVREPALQHLQSGLVGALVQPNRADPSHCRREELAPSLMPTPTNSFDKIISILEEHHGVIASNRPIPAERRFKIRYPLNLSVRFRCLSRMSIFSSV